MRVCIVPEYPMSLMTGGLQVQAQATYEALNALGDGVTAELFEWSTRRPLPDLYHIIGFPTHWQTLASVMRQAKVPYVITMLFGGPRPSQVRMAALRQRIKSRLLRQRDRYETVSEAHRIITIIQADALAASIIYGLPPKKIAVVPNGVNPAFFDARPDLWHERHNSPPFLLCVGAIQPRKNQLLLLEIANQLQLPVVLLGPVLPSEPAYGEAVRAAARANASFGGQWLQDLGPDDPLLISAFAACRGFVLLSQSETQPLSVMQAMAARKPVLLMKADYAIDPLFASLPMVSEGSARELASQVMTWWKQASPSALPPEYTWHGVARQLSQIYQDCLA